MRKVLKNKRGDATLIIIGVVFLFIIAIISLIFSKFFLELLGVLKEDEMISTNNNSVEIIELVESKTIPWLDYVFFISFFAIAIGLIISSIYVDTHPAMMIFFIIILAVAIIFAGILSNVYVTAGETDTLLANYNQFAMTKGVLNNLPLILFVMGLIVAMILYGKGRSSYGGGGM